MSVKPFPTEGWDEGFSSLPIDQKIKINGLRKLYEADFISEATSIYEVLIMSAGDDEAFKNALGIVDSNFHYHKLV